MGKQEQQTPTRTNGKSLSLCTICDQISVLHLQKLGNMLPYHTVLFGSILMGGTKLSDFNAKKSWLTDTEATVLIDYALKMASQNFPFSGRHFKEHADKII